MSVIHNVIHSQPDATLCEVHNVSRYEMAGVARRILEEKHELTLCNGCRAALIVDEWAKGWTHQTTCAAT